MVTECFKDATLGMRLKRLSKLVERRWVLVCLGMWCHAVWQKFTDVSEEGISSIFRVEKNAGIKQIDMI